MTTSCLPSVLNFLYVWSFLTQVGLSTFWHIRLGNQSKKTWSNVNATHTLHTDQGTTKCKSAHYIKYLYSYLLNQNLWMKVRGKNVFFLPHVSSKIWGAAVQFGTFFNIVVLLEITPISFTQFFFRKYDIAFYQVKLSLCTAWRQCGSQDMTNSSLNSVLRQWKVVSFTLQPFYSWYRGSGCDSSWLVHKFHKNSETTYKFLVPEGWHAVLYTAPTNLECSLHHNAIWCFCSVQVNWHILYVTKKKKIMVKY